MKRMITLMYLLAMAVTSGCAGASSELIRTSSISTCTGVFEESAERTPLPPGYADLAVTSSLKTHKAGVYPLKLDAHGTGAYRLLINVDGQAARLRPETAIENCEPRSLRDPEAGNGVRYRFATRIRLKAGKHRVVAVLPDDGIAVAREMVLSKGSSNSLELEPVYRSAPNKQRPGTSGEESFREGVRGVRMILNGDLL